MNTPDEVIKIRTPKSKYPVLEPIKKRFSPRVFSDEQIPVNDMNIIFEAARMAPSGRNHQPWKYFWMRKGTGSYEKLMSSIPERNKWVISAPVIIIACYDPTEPKDGVNRWALHDLGLANMSLILQTQELGYFSRQIGSFDWVKTKEDFQIESPWEPFSLIAMGKLGNESDYQNANQEYVQKDLTETGRKEIISYELK